MKQTFLIKRENAAAMAVAQRCTDFIREAAKFHDVQVVITEPKRTLAENALLHVLLSQVAQEVEWAGKRRDVETWKRLMVSAWCRARGEAIEILPAIDGHGVDLVPVRTSKLSKRDCAELIEFVYAWGADQGIVWDDNPREGLP